MPPTLISMRDGRLCLMIRAWDLNYDHIISSEFTAHFINTFRTREGEIIRYYARTLELKQNQFLLWPVTLVHEIDATSPLYRYTPEDILNISFEITVGLKGASASMGTFTQSQSSYTPREVLWGYRFPSVVKYDVRKQKYVIDQKKLDAIELVDTPMCSASQLYGSSSSKSAPSTPTPGTPGSFSDQVSGFHAARSSSFTLVRGFGASGQDGTKISSSSKSSPSTPTPGTPGSFSDQVSGFHTTRSSFRRKKEANESMPNLLST